MGRLWMDVVQLRRSVLKRPGAPLASLFVMAVGIGLATAMFAVADPFVLRALPYSRPKTLVFIQADLAPAARSRVKVPRAESPTIGEWRARSDLFADVAAFRLGQPLRIELPGGAAAFWTTEVTANIFQMLGAGVSLADDPVAPQVVLSHAACSRLGVAATEASGRILRTHDSRAIRAAGVLPAEFRFPGDLLSRVSDGFTLLGHGTGSEGKDPWQMSVLDVSVLARLQPGQTVETVAAALSRGLARPDMIRVRAWRLETILTRRVRPLALTGLAAGLFVLLVSAGNIANILLAQYSHRSAELACRQALGASRADMLASMLVELAVLATAGAIAGSLAAGAALSAVRFATPEVLTSLGAPAIALREVAFACLSALMAATIAGFSIWPRLHPASPFVTRRGPTEKGSFRKLRFTMTAVQAALAMVLVSGAMLLARSYMNLTRQDTGFSADVAVVSTSYEPDSRSPVLREYIEKTIERIRKLPGVEAVAAVTGPMADGSRNVVAGYGLTEDVMGKQVSLDYFDTVGCARVAGRTFVASDAGRSVVVVNESYARLAFPGENAVGRVVGAGRPAEVVGVVRDTLDVALDIPPAPVVYLLLDDRIAFSGSANIVTYLVNAAGSQRDAGLQAARAVTSVHSRSAIVEVTTLERRLHGSIGTQTFAATMAGLFAVAASGVCAGGVVGMVGFVVARRTREIAVRVSLGATSGRVLRCVSQEAVLAAATGIAAGGLASRWLSSALESLLFGVQPGDCGITASAALLMLILTAGVSLLPALGALRLPPAEALRVE